MELNFNLDNFINEFCSSCSKAQIKHFSKNDVITNYIQNRNQLCLLINGAADLIRYDYNGNKTIIEHFSKGSAFGEIFYTISTNNELFVESTKQCDVLFFKYDYIHNKCKANCKFHSILANNLPEIILNKVIDLNTRIELLTQRSIRDKLINYFTILSTRTFSNTIYLDFSLTNLADYLSVDRSAMMREIKNLKDEGFIDKTGHKITLIK